MNTAAPKTHGLTPRMRDCFDAIQSYIHRNRCSPSFQDIAQALGLRSKSGIFRLLVSLRERGFITVEPGIPRTIKVVPGVGPTHAYLLPTKIEAALAEFCARKGENPVNVVADAVALFLDDAEAQDAAA